MIEHNAWLWFWALINSYLWSVVVFRSRFYFCIFIYINLFTLVSCALFFFTPFEPHHSSPGSCPHLFLFFPCLTLSGLVSSITGNITVGSFLFPQTIVTTPLLVSSLLGSWHHSSEFLLQFHCQLLLFLLPSPLFFDSACCLRWYFIFLSTQQKNYSLFMECKENLHAHNLKVSSHWNLWLQH